MRYERSVLRPSNLRSGSYLRSMKWNRTSEAKSSASAAVRWGRRPPWGTAGADQANGRVDHGKAGQKQRFVLHLRSARLRVGARIIHDRRHFDKVDGHAV